MKKNHLAPFCAGVIFLCFGLQPALGEETPSSVNTRPFDIAIYIGAENFRWQEFDDNGQRLLTEQGPRAVLGGILSNTHRRAEGLLYEIDVQGYLGKVDYDGQDSLGVYTSTDSSYQGARGEVTGGYRWQSTQSAIAAVDLLVKLGADAWRRDIADGANANGFPISGLKEDYVVYYGKVGIGALWPHVSSSSYFQLGARKPLSIDEDVSVFDVSLSPGKKWSVYASYTLKAGGEGRKPFVTFYYDSYRFSKSPPASIGSGIVWQPESDMDVAGVIFGCLL